MSSVDRLKLESEERYGKATITRFEPGVDIGRRMATPQGALSLLDARMPEYAPGDFILTHSDSVTGRLIRFGQSLRYWGSNAKYARWSHAALIVSEDGLLIEAVGSGIRQMPISHYRSKERYLVHLSPDIADARDRHQIVRFARYWLERRSRYGFVTIASIAMSLVTGWRLLFGFDGQFICSGLVACALERTSTIFGRSPTNLMPADLARHFDIRGPDPRTPKSIQQRTA